MVQRLIPIVLLLASFGLSACGGSATPSGKPTAVATIFCYYDALRSIGGDKINASLLLPPRTTPHEYDPTIQAKSQVQAARLIVSNGLGLDTWIDKLADGNTDALRLVISKAVPVELLHTVETSLEDPTAAPPNGAKTPAEDVSQGNPHIWLDPTVQEAAAEKIRAALTQIDPPNTAYYRARADEYIGQIKALDQEFQAAAANFGRREFIGFHSAYDYLAHRYNLKQIAALEEYPEQGITPAQAQRVITLIKQKQIAVIFTENALPSKDADLIVRQTGVKLAVLQPLETYDDPKDTYVSLMRQNLASLKDALGR